ncbi:hypothetical protein [Agrobacterium cavarae]|uniref:hypothetical protein n=1 Tax=Agrobacterium cavarae TaxID=2528239 RepID=UPI003D054A9A
MTMAQAVYTLSNTTATEVVSPSVEPQFVTMHNMTKSSNEYVHYGNASVTLANSPHLDPGETLSLTLLSGESLHAMSDPDGLDLGVLVQKQN